MVLFSILAAAWQLTWLPELTILTVAPNLILAGILAFAICHKEAKNYWWVLIFALAFDLLAGRPFGVFTLSACLMFFSVELLASVIFKQNNFLAILLLVIVGVLFFEFYQFLLIKAFDAWHLAEPFDPAPFYFYAILPIKIFYNGMLALVWLLIFKKSRWLNNYG